MATARSARKTTAVPNTNATMVGPQVDHRHPDYEAALPDWMTVRDCISGQRTVKRAGEKYLPAIMPHDKTQANKDRNEAYLSRAVFVGMTRRTAKGLVGQVFAKPPVLELPGELEDLRVSIDGSAVSWDQQAKQALSDVLAIGRCGILVDYPKVEQPAVTVAQQTILGLRPTIQYYFAEQIINWRVEMVGGKRKTTLVVLEEKYTDKDDGFKREEGTQWRVLRLVDNVYEVSVYRRGNAGFVHVEGSPWVPTQANGKPFEEIPFHFMGSDNNDPGIDDAPMIDLANLNIAHYRNSADFEEMVFIMGQPTPWFSGLTQKWVDDVWKDGIALGSRSPIPLPQNATAGLLQVSESTIALEAMKHKERQAVALGARLVEELSVQRTATEFVGEEATELSILQACALNVSAAYTKAMEWLAMFAGTTVVKDTHQYLLNTDFEIARMSTAARAQLLAEWQAGAISDTEYRDVLRRVGVATQDDEEAFAEVQARTEADMQLANANMPDAQPGGGNGGVA